MTVNETHRERLARLRDTGLLTEQAYQEALELQDAAEAQHTQDRNEFIQEALAEALAEGGAPAWSPEAAAGLVGDAVGPEPQDLRAEGSDPDGPAAGGAHIAFFEHLTPPDEDLAGSDPGPDQDPAPSVPLNPKVAEVEAGPVYHVEIAWKDGAQTEYLCHSLKWLWAVDEPGQVEDFTTTLFLHRDLVRAVRVFKYPTHQDAPDSLKNSVSLSQALARMQAGRAGPPPHPGPPPDDTMRNPLNGQPMVYG